MGQNYDKTFNNSMLRGFESMVYWVVLVMMPFRHS